MIQRNSSVRKLEGLETHDAEIFRDPSATSLDLAHAILELPTGVTLEADLSGGQKTGFFLDQWENIERTAQLLRRAPIQNKDLRVVDVFSYVGHWGVALGAALKRAGARSVTVEFWDASASALERASRNAERHGLKAETHEQDLVETRGFGQGPAADVVVVDPPALIKNRKHVPQGRHAYLQLNTAGLARVKPGGLYVSCSCSQLLEETEFDAAISKAAHRNAIHGLRWVMRGGQAPDHPMGLEFPEGRYLKSSVFLRSN